MMSSFAKLHGPGLRGWGGAKGGRAGAARASSNRTWGHHGPLVDDGERVQRASEIASSLATLTLS